MIRRKLPVLLLSALLALTFGQASAQGTKDTPPGGVLRGGKVTKAEKLAAAKRARALGLKPGLAGKAIHRAPGAAIPPLPGIDGPGGTPHYFGPYANWANSPLPAAPILAVTLDAGGSGYANPLGVVLDAYGAGSGAGVVTFTLGAGGAIATIAGGLGGTGYQAPFVFIEDDTTLCGAVDAFGVPTQPACGTGAAATASLDPALVTGGIRKFVDKMPGLTAAGANTLVTPNRLGPLGPVTTSGQYIPVATPENFATANLPFSDLYVIGLVEYYEKFHSDLPPTRMRGYVQLTTPTNAPAGGGVALNYLDGTPILYPGTATPVMAFDYPHYLGPLIVAGSNLPARIKFFNLLPPGAGGDLILPVDETVMGSGMGPQGGAYSQNRATVHMHGNNTVWLSDGTTHQWITPAPASAHAYPKGVSARNVPDMADPGEGAMTFYYTNAQSARLLFYHDHAMGITRLNVYAGEAAGFLITDQVETDMIAGTNVSGINPGLLKVLPDLGIPLVIQDKSWTDPDVVFAQDPTWNWGTGPKAAGKLTAAAAGDLWYPHVYMSAQNPWDLTGTNAFGRWHYGPWFVAPTAVCTTPGQPAGCIDVGAVTNPFHEPNCDLFPPDPLNFPCFAPWEPPLMPGVPNPSMPGEAFMDTPLINGTVYPWIEVQAKPTRFRVLNAANDRFFNLQLYVAADNASPTVAGTTGAVPCTGAVPVARCTEVAMVPISVNPANQYALTPSGIPDATFKGPNWIQIGTEGGFLPAPVVLPQQPVGWNLNATSFNFGNVNQTSLALGPAERADVIVDFTGLAGQTLILYNDAPAAYPAGVSTYDYYTGDGTQIDIGGAPNTLPGYGPNTRTVAQIRVIAAAAPLNADVNITNLNAVFAKGPGIKRGVFEATQDPIIVPQAAYGSAYRNLFPSSAALQYGQIADTQHTFQPINGAGVLQPAVTIPLQTKGIHDEMGGVYDTGFGRMSGMIGLSNSTPGAAILSMYGYASPPTDIISGSVSGSIAGTLGDGTQIWRIFHNGVDTHPIHVHLFNAQLLNRVGQDGIMLPPDANELGWKDTFKINPLEITFLAMKPIIPTPAQLPFPVPNSVRLIDPTLPLNAPLIAPPPAGWLDPQGVAINQILNHPVNFGWEYVWHCHILAHEEMDMMHSLVFAIAPNAPTGLSAVVVGSGSGRAIVLNWTDNSANETGFTIQRASNAAFTGTITTFTVLPNTTTFSNIIGNTFATFYYRVFASNVVGDTNVYPASQGFPKTTTTSGFSNTVLINTNVVPAAPSAVNVTGAVLSATRALFTVTWTDNSTTETGFRVQWARNAAFTSGVGTGTVGANVRTFTTPGGALGLLRGVPYYFRVQSFNGAGNSAYVNFGAPTPVTVP